MTIPRPPIKYTEMAIYIDNHIYTDDCDDDKVFIYLYYLSLMLAHKNKLFKRQEYYEDFALTFAEDMYMRLKNPKQEMLKEDGAPKMHKLTSILNYMKRTIYGRKVAFEQEKYSQSFSVNQKLEKDVRTTQFSVINQINYYKKSFNEVELEVCLNDICKTIKGFLVNIPYYNNKKEWENIYISCLLTLLNSFILSKTDDIIINEIKYNNHKEDKKIYDMELVRQKESNNNVILYHLDFSMKNYIDILCKKIKKYLSETYKISSYDSYIDEKDLINSTIAEMENNEDYLEFYE